MKSKKSEKWKVKSEKWKVKSEKLKKIIINGDYII